MTENDTRKKAFALARALSRVDLALGAWLFVSAFLLPHTLGHAIHDAVLGLVIVALSFGAIRARRSLRHANAVIAVGLAVSLLLFSRPAPITIANVLVIAIVLFSASIIPDPWRMIMLRGRNPRSA